MISFVFKPTRCAAAHVYILQLTCSLCILTNYFPSNFVFGLYVPHRLGSCFSFSKNSTTRLNLKHCVPLATELAISLIILTQMKILQRNLNRSTFVV